MKTALRTIGLIASMLAMSVVCYGAVTVNPNGYTLTANGDTFGVSSSVPRPKIIQARIVTTGGAKSFTLKAYGDGVDGNVFWDLYNHRDDNNTSTSAGTTCTTTINFLPGAVIPTGGCILHTNDTGAQVFILTDKTVP